jgi:hypothetical protein
VGFLCICTQKCWDDNLFRDSYFMLAPFMKKPFQKKGKSGSGKVDGAGKTDKVWFCKDYNRNRCSYKESHKHSFRAIPFMLSTFVRCVG